MPLFRLNIFILGHDQQGVEAFEKSNEVKYLLALEVEVHSGLVLENLCLGHHFLVTLGDNSDQEVEHHYQYDELLNDPE